MKKLFLTFCAAFVGLTVFSFDAEARRLGGGGSIGMQRNTTVMPKQAAPAPAAPAATPGKPAATPQAPAPQSGMSRWMGPLAGIAAGLGLAALFSHLGIGEGMGSLLMILALVAGAVLLFRLLARRSQPQNGMRYAGAGADAAAPARFEPVNAMGGGAAPEAAAPGNVPAGFDVDGFLRNAKLNFVRLQAANDAGNLEDIRQFTTPEIYAETKLQLDERGKEPQHTDVVQLHAQLLDVTSEDKRHVASVRFYGLIREEANASPQSFDEVWHMSKPVDGSSGWVVAGIQQVQ
jgi:predicted lipid-binding transport protein (Tim44 family)